MKSMTFILFMPVIKKVIMKQCTADQWLFINIQTKRSANTNLYKLLLHYVHKQMSTVLYIAFLHCQPSFLFQCTDGSWHYCKNTSNGSIFRVHVLLHFIFVNHYFATYADYTAKMYLITIPEANLFLKNFLFLFRRFCRLHRQVPDRCMHFRLTVCLMHRHKSGYPDVPCAVFRVLQELQ